MAQSSDLNRAILIDFAAAIAEFAQSVISPGPYRAVRLQRQAVVTTGVDGDHTTQPDYRNGSVTIGRRSITELAKIVISPRPGNVLSACAPGEQEEQDEHGSTGKRLPDNFVER